MINKNNKIVYFVLTLLNSIVMIVCLTYTIQYICEIAGKKSASEYYVESANLQYSVHLKNNQYIDENVMGMGKNYITDYVDFIQFQYEYIMKNELEHHYDGTYEIVATVRASYKDSIKEEDNPEILTKEYILDSGQFDVDAKEKKLALSNKISLTEYEKMISAFKGETNFPLTSILELTYRVKLTGNKTGETSYQTIVKIPLMRDVFSIEVSGTEKQKHVLYQTISDTNYEYAILLMSLVIALTVIDIILLTKLLSKQESEAEKEIHSYLKKYDDYIVNTKTAPDLENAEVIEITDFMELLTMATNSNVSIFYYENRKVAIFYIKEESIYMYCIDKKN